MYRKRCLISRFQIRVLGGSLLICLRIAVKERIHVDDPGATGTARARGNLRVGPMQGVPHQGYERALNSSV